MNPTRVLFVVGSMEVGGVQSGIMSFARMTPPDEARFDVAVLSAKEGFHEAEFRRYGRVYHLPLLRAKNKYTGIACLLLNNVICFYRLRRLLKAQPYDAVHAKLLEYAAPAMQAARKCGVPVRIAQSHVDRPACMSAFHRWYYRWSAGRIEKNATVKLAVSEKAIDMLFAPYRARIIKNPTVNLEKLNPALYPQRPHGGIRLIQVGTYSERKNQRFSMDVLKALLDEGQDVQLAFVGFSLGGDGYQRAVEDRAQRPDLAGRVTFYPRDADVPLLLSESDYMLIPSLREGLPNVALEAQAMGVPCFLSDAITKAADCGLCTFLPLESGPKAWARQILAYREAHGSGKRPADLSAWDQREVIRQYLPIWRGE